MKHFKEKGFAYERKIASQFGQWWCGDFRALWRNTNSGARATVVGQVFGGDVIPANASCGSWPLCIEIKKAEGWSVDAFLNGNPGEPLLSYMLQCLSSSQIGCNKIPILICAKNYRKPLVFLYRCSHQSLFRVPGSIPFLGRVKWQAMIPRKLYNQYPWDGGPVDFYLLHLDTFFKFFSREDFL